MEGMLMRVALSALLAELAGRDDDELQRVLAQWSEDLIVGAGPGYEWFKQYAPERWGSVRLRFGVPVVGLA